jgi:hypothetical protein
VEVRTRNLIAVGIPVWWAIDVQPHQNDRLPDAILIRRLGQFDLGTSHVEHERFPSIGGCQLDREAFAGAREGQMLVTGAMFFHRNQQVELLPGSDQCRPFRLSIPPGSRSRHDIAIPPGAFLRMRRWRSAFVARPDIHRLAIMIETWPGSSILPNTRAGTAVRPSTASTARGQAERDGHAPTLGHFFHDLAHEFLHVDGTIFRTLKALFFQPGKLTEEYWAGHIVSWVRPVRVFLIVVALHLLVSTGVGPLNYQLLLNRKPNGDLNLAFGTKVQGIAVQKGSTPVPEAERREFFEKFGHAYATIRYTSVVAFALASWLLYRRRQPYFVSHLIAGLHFYSFWYALAMLVSVPARWSPDWNPLSLISGVYLFLALGRLYRERWYLRLFKAMVLWVFLIATELGLGLAAGWWVVRLVGNKPL